ncbi:MULTISPECIES: slr1658 superfamily regulator [Sinorhizobium]|uniref:ATP-binding protein n=1 Tax=Sinorhizobium psoraleae TaxID=520838 RepID=A0ABT4KQJ3_9HYPH|nr:MULTISPECIES: ATP-binding protein [Sinorhizobium]MCZ4094240.1 ATP-binding protein [Sinorhizobium psoraleae]MDK1490870.1 ATP-binding protein [Sinorhizobium sp. 8-89]
MTTLYGLEDLAIGTGEDVTRLRLFEGPLDLSWKHCAITSDFVAEFAALRYKTTRNLYKEVRHNVGYLTNELIENAMKFRASGEIIVEASIAASAFRAKVSNFIDKDTAEQFQHLLSEITTGDPSDLLIERIEANATGSGSGSGLGLLTLMSDYGAHFAWVFGPGGQNSDIPLETYAAITVPELSN